MRPRRVLAALGVALLLAAPARAQQDEAGAREHFRAGVMRFDAKDYAAALAEFSAAYAAEPSPTIARNIGLTQKELGQYADACTTLDDMLAGSPGLAPDVVAATRSTLADMRPRVALVHVSLSATGGGAPSDVAVTVDGHPVPAARLVRGVFLPPGAHYFSAHAAGFADAAKSETVTAGQEVSVELVLARAGESGVVLSNGPLGGAPPPRVTRSPGAAAPGEGRPPRVRRGWAAVDGEAFASSLPLDGALFPGGSQVVAGFGISGHVAYNVRPYLALGGQLEADVLTPGHPAQTTLGITQAGLGPYVRLMTPWRVHLFVGVTGGVLLVGTSTQLPGETSEQSTMAFTGYALGEAGVDIDVSRALAVEAEGFGGVAGIDGMRTSGTGASATSQPMYTESLTWRAGGRAGVVIRF